MNNNINEKDTRSQEELFRFMQDLEFIQCLSNPFYLHYLSNSNYFKEPEFLNYLSYLQYFKKKEYMKYITYSRSLVFLDLIQYDFFRQALAYKEFIDYLYMKIREDWLEIPSITSSIQTEAMNTISNQNQS